MLISESGCLLLTVIWISNLLRGSRSSTNLTEMPLHIQASQSRTSLKIIRSE